MSAKDRSVGDEEEVVGEEEQSEGEEEEEIAGLERSQRTKKQGERKQESWATNEAKERRKRGSVSIWTEQGGNVPHCTK